MAFELKPGQGTLHVITDKEGNPNRPDYSGQLNVDGTMYRLSGWIKTTQGGKQWVSLNCELPQPKAALESPPPQKPQFNPDDDQIPF